METKDVIARMKILADAENASIREKLDKVKILNAEIEIHREHVSTINTSVRECEDLVEQKGKIKPDDKS